jgi:hypothetical protein
MPPTPLDDGARPLPDPTTYCASCGLGTYTRTAFQHRSDGCPFANEQRPHTLTIAARNAMWTLLDDLGENVTVLRHLARVIAWRLDYAEWEVEDASRGHVHGANPQRAQTGPDRSASHS